MIIINMKQNIFLKVSVEVVNRCHFAKSGVYLFIYLMELHLKIAYAVFILCRFPHTFLFFCCCCCTIHSVRLVTLITDAAKKSKYYWQSANFICVLFILYCLSAGTRSLEIFYFLYINYDIVYFDITMHTYEYYIYEPKCTDQPV